MEYFKILPVELTLEILSRLPTDSILECKLVCTTWRNIVSHHPSFSKRHLHHLTHPAAIDAGKLSFIATTWNNYERFHYIEYNENHDQSTRSIERITRINLRLPFRDTSCHGSCNGLICFVDYNSLVRGITHKAFCICNPITKEYIVLPEINCSIDHYICWTSGFGYVPSTNEYKVVVIRISMNPQIVEVHVYTLGSGNGWRNLGEFDSGPSEHCGAGIFANGAIYWLDVELGMIFTFDLAEEKFGEHISLPPLSPGRDLQYDRIGVLDGVLFCAICSVEGEDDYFYDIWLLKKKNDTHDMKEREEHQSFGWSKEFRVKECGLLSGTKSNGVLTYFDEYLNVYDTKTSTSERLVDFDETFHYVFLHKNTLVSLKELGEEDVKMTDSVDQPLKQL